jgi:fucose permease
MKSDSTANRTLVMVSFVFFALGLIMASIGPVLGELSSNTNTSLAAVGAIFTALFLGALVTQLFSSSISSRVGLHPILLAGTVLAALGMTGISLSRSLPLLLISAMVLGLGHGAVNFSGNLSIATLFYEKRATAINFANIFYALGAFIGPALAGFSVIKFETGLPVFWLGALLILSAGLMMIRTPLQRTDLSQTTTPATPTKTALLASPILWVVVVLSFFYGGSETGMSGWTTTYLQQSVGFPLERAAFVTSAFYLALMVGRMLCSWLGSRLTELQILISTLAVTFAGTLLLITGYGNPILSTLAVLGIGLGYGGTYPTMIAFSTATFKESAAQAASVIISVGSIGGMALPALQGVILEQAGAQPTTFMVAGMAVMMLLASLVGARLVHPVKAKGK